MTQRFGIDTSILVRLLTGEPASDFEYCVVRLSELVQQSSNEIFASNQVIGEAYVAVQHHYGVTKGDARSGLMDVLQSGLVSPLNGRPVIDALAAPEHPGLFERLIADDYQRAGLETLTLDPRVSRLPQTRRI